MKNKPTIFYLAFIGFISFCTSININAICYRKYVDACKDNDVSIKRLSDNSEIQDEAYFGCHTDITIPYYELGDIIAIQKDGTEIPIMLSGKFVLSGTEKLNIDGM